MMQIIDATMKAWRDVLIDHAVMVELAEMRKENRFFLRAFICDGPCRQVVDQIGSSTFAEIFVRRPSGCRYAVMEPVGRQYFMVVDMFDTRINGLEVRMGKHTVYPTLDAAIAAPMLNYSHE